MNSTNRSLQRLFGTRAGLVLATLLATQIQIQAAGTNSTAESEPIAGKSIDQQMIGLRKQVDDAEAAYMKAPESDNLWTSYSQLNQTNLPRIFELAQQEPQSETSFEMFKWIVMNRQIRMRPLYTKAVQSLAYLRDYDATNPDVTRVCRALGHNWDSSCKPAVDFLRKVADVNPDRDARGQALLALANFKKQDAQDLNFFLNAPPVGANFQKRKADFLDTKKNQTPASLSREAETLYHEVRNQYADCPSLGPTNTWQVKSTLGDAAKADLFELEHLSIGDIAPGLEGPDIDGKKLKLKRYRGKIVLVSFWASWCGPCMQMVPSEVRLAQRMKGKSFAIIGVNGDPRREAARKAVEKDHMTWPSFYSDKGPDGPIPTAWNVHGWPTYFILDKKGVIRFKGLGYGQETEKFLDAEVDLLLKGNNATVQAD